MKLFDALFRCLHKRMTFPMSSKRGHHRSPAERPGIYVVCLDCGKEFAYDWNKMRIQQPGKYA